MEGGRRRWMQNNAIHNPRRCLGIDSSTSWGNGVHVLPSRGRLCSPADSLCSRVFMFPLIPHLYLFPDSFLHLIVSPFPPDISFLTLSLPPPHLFFLFYVFYLFFLFYYSFDSLINHTLVHIPKLKTHFCEFIRQELNP